MRRAIQACFARAGVVALVCNAVAVPAFAQRLGSGGGVEIAWWRVAGALMLCLALAVAGAFALRVRLRAGAPVAKTKPFPAWGPMLRTLHASPAAVGRSDRRLKLVDTLRLSHQVDVCLLDCDGRSILIAATAQGAFVIGSEAGAKDGAS